MAGLAVPDPGGAAAAMELMWDGNFRRSWVSGFSEIFNLESKAGR